MFSLFEKANAPKKIKDFTFNELIKIIKNHPEKDFIESIRQKRRNNDLSYKTDKRKLLSFTPNCSVNLAREFNRGGFSKNFKAGSGYIYIDIDDVGDAVLYKKEFIKKYSDIVSLVAVSSSLGGLFILIRVNHLISSIEDFSLVWEYFNTNVFSGKVDPNTKDFNRTNFITSDPDVYINYENEFDVSFILDNKKEKVIKSIKPKKGIIQDLITPFTNKSHTIPYNSSRLLLHTHIDFNKDEFIKFEKIENFIECRIFYHIIDTKKRPTFTKIIIGLLQLNGENNLGAMFNYMKWINDNRTTQPMKHEKLVELFDSVKKDWSKGLLKFEGDIKYIHFNQSYTNCKKAKAATNKMLLCCE